MKTFGKTILGFGVLLYGWSFVTYATDCGKLEVVSFYGLIAGAIVMAAGGLITASTAGQKVATVLSIIGLTGFGGLLSFGMGFSQEPEGKAVF